MRKPYQASRGDKGDPFVSGPDLGACCAFSYYGGTLDPGSRFENFKQAEQSARLCNMAYSVGYAAAMREVRTLLNSTEAL